MLGLDFAPASSAGTDLNLARVVGRRSRKPSKTVNVRLMILLRKRRNQVSEMEDFLLDANFTDCSELFAVWTYSVQAECSLSGDLR